MKQFYFYSYKIYKKISLLLLFFTGLLLCAQTAGDYRSLSGGTLGAPLPWASASSWQVYDGSAWVNAASYPGQTGTSNAYTVTVQKDSYISITGSATYSFGTLNVYGVLVLRNTSGNTTNVNFNTTSVLNVYGPTPAETGTGIGNGTIYWDGKVDMNLPNGGVVHIYNYNNDTNNTLKDNGLQSSNCNNNNSMYIGTQRFAVCTGGNASFTFSEINIGGGTIEAQPSVSPSAVCEGETVSLSGNYSGTIGTAPTYSWTSTKPDGSVNTVVNPNQQNPGVQNPLTMVGTYRFTLQVSTTYGGTTYTNAKSVFVTVNARPAVTNMTATVCSKENFTITPVNGTNGLVPAGTTYSWSAPVMTGALTGGTSGSGSAITGTLINTSGSPETATYTVTPTWGAGCTGNTFTVTVTVNPVNLTGNTNITSIGGTSQLNATPSGGTYLSTNTAVATVSSTGLVTAVATGTTVIRYTAPNGCVETLTINVGSICYNPATSPGVGGTDSKMGITTLKRAGDESNWPMVRKGAYLVLEAKTRGFVLPRMTTAQISAIPAANLVEGMVVYNTSVQCLNVYDGTSWKCFRTQTCP